MWSDKEDGAGDDLDMPVAKGDRPLEQGVKTGDVSPIDRDASNWCQDHVLALYGH